jgi:hypothetical protein
MANDHGQRRGSSPGLAVDSRGGPVIDPTENVKSLMAASLEALAQLRASDKELHEIKATHLKEMADLRASHARELRANDTERYGAIRQVDITNANAASATTQTAIQALAKSTEDTRKTLADAMANREARVDERLGSLERTVSLGEGKQRVADPLLAELVSEMKTVNKGLAAGGGVSKGIGTAWIVALGGIAALGTLVGIAAIGVAVVIYLAK